MVDIPTDPNAVAQTINEASASLAALVTSLNETNVKLTSVTENISKIAEGIAGQTNTADSARNFENVFSVGSVESVRASLARFTQDYAGETIENAKRSRNWFDKQIADVLAHDNDVRALITAGIRNTTETDNMVAKNSVDFARAANAQTTRHADTQLFQTSMGEGAEVDMASGSIVNDLLAAVESLKAVADSLASKVAAPTAKT
jgi:hypothetical protein